MMPLNNNISCAGTLFHISPTEFLAGGPNTANIHHPEITWAPRPLKWKPCLADIGFHIRISSVVEVTDLSGYTYTCINSDTSYFLQAS